MELKYKKSLTPLVTLLVTSVLLSSCYKKFEPESYAPPLNIGGYTSSSEISPGNLVGYWAFNGSLIDSVSGTSGVNTGTSFSGGVKGQAMQGALNGYVLFSPGPEIRTMNSFTITYWVNSPPPSTGIIGLVNLAKTNGFWGNINMFFENGSTNTSGFFKANVHNGTADKWVEKNGIVNLFNSWVALALSYDAPTSTFKMYMNGNVIQTTVAAGFGPLNFANVGDLVFGTVHFMTNPSQTSATGAQGWASYLTGQLDEVRIYNKALSDEELNSLVKLEGRGK